MRARRQHVVHHQQQQQQWYTAACACGGSADGGCVPQRSTHPPCMPPFMETSKTCSCGALVHRSCRPRCESPAPKAGGRPPRAVSQSVRVCGCTRPLEQSLCACASCRGPCVIDRKQQHPCAPDSWLRARRSSSSWLPPRPTGTAPVNALPDRSSFRSAVSPVAPPACKVHTGRQREMLRCRQQRQLQHWQRAAARTHASPSSQRSPRGGMGPATPAPARCSSHTLSCALPSVQQMTPGQAAQHSGVDGWGRGQQNWARRGGRVISTRNGRPGLCLAWQPVQHPT